MYSVTVFFVLIILIIILKQSSACMSDSLLKLSKLLCNMVGYEFITFEFMKTQLKLKKKDYKIGVPIFWDSNHHSSSVQTASNQILQNIIKIGAEVQEIL